MSIEHPEVNFLLELEYTKLGPTSSGNNRANIMREIDHIFYNTHIIRVQKLT